MARITPFRGWRYRSPHPGSLAALVTPPYDVISAAQRERLAASSPFNFSHLILPQPEAGMDPYAAAARTFQAWRQGGVLERDGLPTLTLHRQTFVLEQGCPRTRIGLLALLDLPAPGTAEVRPHESTLAAPRQDRTRLMLAVRAHLSPIFLLAPDPDGALQGILAAAAVPPYQETFLDPDGVQHDLTLSTDPRLAASVQELLAARQLIIADGHHRYESAVACHQALRQELGAADPAVAAAAQVLVEVVSLASPGLTVLPIHRLVRRLGPFDGSAFLARIRRRFRLEEIPSLAETDTAARDDLFRLITAAGPGTMGLAVSGQPGYCLLRRGVADDDDPLQALDVSFLHRELLGQEMGIDAGMVERGGSVEFTRDAHAALDAVRSGAAQAAFLLNPTRMEELERVTAAARKMPQKSTYFYPKIPAGLVIHAFDAAG